MYEVFFVSGTDNALVKATRVRFLVTTVGDERYAIESGHVEQATAFDPDAVTAVPNTPSVIAGVMAVDGKVVIVFDLREHVGAPVTAEGELVILDRSGRPVGLIVDSIDGLETFTTDDIDELSTLTSEILHADEQWLRAALTDDTGRIFVLDPGAVVGSVRGR